MKPELVLSLLLVVGAAWAGAQEPTARDVTARVEALRKELKSPDATIRRLAFRELGKLGPRAAAAAPDLVALLSDRTLTEAQIIRPRGLLPHRFDPMLFSGQLFHGELPEAIRRIGRQAVPALTAALDRDDHVCNCALSILAAIGPEAAPAVPMIHALLTRGATVRRIPAIRALAGIGPAARISIPVLKALYAERRAGPEPFPYDLGGEFSLEAARALVSLDRAFINRELESPDPVRRRLAAFALSGAVIVASTHPAYQRSIATNWLRHRAYSAVGLPDKPNLSTLLEALRGEDENARAVALASYPSDLPRDRRNQRSVLKRLATHLDDPNPFVRRAVVSWLPTYEERDLASRLVGTRLNDSDIGVRRAAFRALRALDARLLKPAVQQAVEDADEQVAVEAVHILARLARSSGAIVPDVPIEPFLKAAGAGRPERVRVAAIEALSHYRRNDETAAPFLIEALHDPGTAIRRAALRRLRTTFQGQADSALPRVVELLADPDPGVRYWAVLFIGSVGWKALDLEGELRKLTRDPDDEVRRHAAYALGFIEEKRRLRDAVLGEAEKGDPSSRIRALRECKDLGAEGYLLLIEALGAEDEAVRRAAASHLSRFEFGPRLLAMLETREDWRLRASIVEILSWLTSNIPSGYQHRERARFREQVVDRKSLILQTMEDERPEVRRAAAGLVGNLARELHAVDRIYDALRDPDEGVRERAFSALRQLREPKWPLSRMVAALESLDESDWTSRLVLREFCVRGDKAAPALPALIKGLRRAPGTLRGDFAFAVGKVGGEHAAEAVPDIRRLLHDEAPTVRSSAAGGLGAIGPPARACLPDLVRMAREDPDRSARFSARQALGKVSRGTDDAVPILMDMLSESEVADRTWIIQSLGDVGPAAREAVPYLERIAREGRSSDRSAAREALQMIRSKPDARDVGRTRWVSRDLTADMSVSGHCWNPAISSDGRFVVFDSDAAALPEKEGTRGPGRGSTRHVYVFDCERSTTAPVSVSSSGEPGNAESQGAAVSADGLFVAFISKASNLVPGDTNQRMDVFVHDRETRKTTRVSVSSSGERGSGRSGGPSLSGDGRFVAFTSYADNLTEEDDNREPDVFVHDRSTGRTEGVSVNPAGKTSRGIQAQISADGNFVVFTSRATDLDPEHSGGVGGIYLRDLRAKTTRWIAQGWNPSISAHGRFVAYRRCEREGIQPGPEDSGVFLHDVVAGVTTTIYYARNPGRTSELGPTAISADGQRVAFASHQTSLVKGDTNGVMDVFVYDQRTKSVVRASVSSAGHQANATSHTAAISGDGRFVAFVSFDDFLVEGDRNRVPDILVRRLD